ncbi:unnamed protein product [Aphanomyces euteiches]
MCVAWRLRRHYTSAAEKSLSKAPFGTLLGITDGGVHVYSSDYSSLDPAVRSNRAHFQSLLGTVTTGYKWQCVELARRYLLVNYGVVFDNIAMAYDIFRLRTVTRVADDQLICMHAYPNGVSTDRPGKSSLVIWDPVGEFTQTGHVAVVVAVTDTHVDIIEQNVHDAVWPSHRHYSRRLPARVDPNTGAYSITCTYPGSSIMGWMSIDFSSEYNYEDVPLVTSQDLRSVGDHQFAMSSSGHAALEFATDQLQHMILDATDYVLQHSERYHDTFAGIPCALWPQIRAAWFAQKPDSLVSQFAFALTDDGLHWTGFRSNSLPDNVLARGATHSTEAALVQAWQSLDVRGPLHMLMDSPAHAVAYAAAKKAGLTCHSVPSVNSLAKDDSGKGFVDAHGNPVQTLWHATPWPTLLLSHHPALTDRSVRWIEPLWTVLSNASAMAPVLRELYPRHPILQPATMNATSAPPVLHTYAVKERYAGAFVQTSSQTSVPLS